MTVSLVFLQHTALQDQANDAMATLAMARASKTSMALKATVIGGAMTQHFGFLNIQ
jgi:hypothetical protein